MSRIVSGTQVGKPGPRNVTLPNVKVQKGQAEVECVLTVDTYKGVKHGRNGNHEIVDGHIDLFNADSNSKVIDTQKVELAMNVKSPKDSSGLPKEIPLTAGQQLEVQGIYIPAAKAHAPGGAAVIHFTHAPDGYVITPDGLEYA